MTPFVLLTRPDGKNTELNTRLEQAGLDVLALPVLELEASAPSQAPDPAAYDLIVFVSGFAVGCYFRALENMGLRSWPRGVYAAAVGAASANALLRTGMAPADRIVAPDADSRQDSEALWEELQRRGIHPRRVLIVCGDSGRAWLAERLRREGADVQRHRAYIRKPAQWRPCQLAALAGLVRSQRRAVVLLTSSQGVDAWLSCMKEADMMALVTRTDFVVVHERIARHLRQSVAHLYPDAKATIIVSKPDDKIMFRSIMTLALA